MDNQIKLFFAGDFCSKLNPTTIVIGDELKRIIKSCNTAVVNFEVPLKPDILLPKQSRERYFQNDNVPEFLRELGFSLFSIANNHMFDWGNEGFLKTKKILGEESFGAGTYEEAYRVKVVEVLGKKIGFLSLSFAAYIGVFDDVENHEGLGCAYINDVKVNHIIYESKQRLDYLFILPHDGIEYLDVPLPETVVRYRDFIDWGADGVIGSHPHCPQGWEEYKGKPIFYSLGNFFFNSKEDPSYRVLNRPHWYEGRCVVVTLSENGMSWEVFNTLNTDNIALDIDRSDQSMEHNETICHYLHDKNAYTTYLIPILRSQYRSDMKKIGGLFQPHSIRDIVRMIKNYLCHKRNRGDIVTNVEVKNILRNDLKRSRIVRMMN